MKPIKLWMASFFWLGVPGWGCLANGGETVRLVGICLSAAFIVLSFFVLHKCRQDGPWRFLRRMTGIACCGIALAFSFAAFVAPFAPPIADVPHDAYADYDYSANSASSSERRATGLAALFKGRGNADSRAVSEQREMENFLKEVGSVAVQSAIRSALAPSPGSSPAIARQVDYLGFPQPQHAPNQQLNLKPSYRPPQTIYKDDPSSRANSASWPPSGQPQGVPATATRPSSFNGSSITPENDSAQGFSLYRPGYGTVADVHPKPSGQGYTISERGRGTVAEVYSRPSGQGFTVTQPGRGTVAEVHEKPFGLGYSIAEPGRGTVADVNPKPGGGFTIRERGQGPVIEVSK